MYFAVLCNCPPQLLRQDSILQDYLAPRLDRHSPENRPETDSSWVHRSRFRILRARQGCRFLWGCRQTPDVERSFSNLPGTEKKYRLPGKAALPWPGLKWRVPFGDRGASRSTPGEALHSTTTSP